MPDTITEGAGVSRVVDDTKDRIDGVMKGSVAMERCLVTGDVTESNRLDDVSEVSVAGTDNDQEDRNEPTVDADGNNIDEDTRTKAPPTPPTSPRG